FNFPVLTQRVYLNSIEEVGMKRTTLAIVSAFVVGALAAALSASAQQVQTRDAARDNVRSDQTDRSVTADQKNLGKLDRRTSGETFRASQLIGANIQNDNGDSVGEVNDLVIDSNSGRIRYAAVQYGGFLGVGSKLFAVPF